MTALQVLRTSLWRINNFSGRAPRSEYWWTVLFAYLIVLVVQVVAFVVVLNAAGPEAVEEGQITEENQIMLALFGMSATLLCALILPVMSRRFKDHGWRGGWFRVASWLNFAAAAAVILAFVATLIGRPDVSLTLGGTAFALVYLPFASIVCCFWIGFVRSDPDDNRFGPNPLKAPT